MAPPRTQTAAVVWNPVLLWLLIHGGDPAPDAKTSRLTAALTIQTLAGSLSAGARKEIQQIIGREIGEAAGAFGR
jgi:hypothetical protein